MSRRAMPRPRPRLAPVMTTLGIGPPQFAAAAHLQPGDEAELGRDLVARQPVPAGFEDVLGKRGVGGDAGGGDDVGDDDGAGDRALARPHQRHAHRRMAVERGLDLLGMHLLAADIDDAAAPPDEMVAAVAPLDHVAGIDEAVLAGQWRRTGTEIAARVARRADAQRAALDLHLDRAAAALDQRFWKAGRS